MEVREVTGALAGSMAEKDILREQVERMTEALRDIETDCESIANEERYEKAERRAWHAIAVKARAALAPKR